MRNLKLTIEYDGTRYHGWQVQPNQPTIQGCIEAVFEQISGGKAQHMVGASRTDAGVHAQGQVATILTDLSMPLPRLLNTLNRLLPGDIAIHDIYDVPLAFHARRSARSKRYRYAILNRVIHAPLLRYTCWHIEDFLHLDQMQEGLMLFKGRHDFSAFNAAGNDFVHAIRDVLDVDLLTEGEMVFIEIEATAFVKQMVRNIVGTIVEIGLGKRSVDDMARLIASKDRSQCAPPAPPHGLTLLHVRY